MVSNACMKSISKNAQLSAEVTVCTIPEDCSTAQLPHAWKLGIVEDNVYGVIAQGVSCLSLAVQLTYDG